MTRYSAIAVVMLLPGLIRSQPPSTVAPAPRADTAAELAASLRSILLLSLPEPLYEDDSHWGGQKMVASRIRLKAKDGKPRLETEKKPKNDGLWWKVHVTADKPKETLHVEVRDLKKVEPGKLAFTTHLALDTNFDYDRQRWGQGAKLWGSGLRGRVRIKLALTCEVSAILEDKGGLLPEALLRIRVLNSEVDYEKLKVDHVGGIGGDGAKVIGGKILDAMRQWRPSLERKLLDKANSAIIKAGDIKEVRINLFGVMKQ